MIQIWLITVLQYSVNKLGSYKTQVPLCQCMKSEIGLGGIECIAQEIRRERERRENAAAVA